MIRASVIRATTLKNGKKRAFLLSLARDLRSMNIRVKVQSTREEISFVASLPRWSPDRLQKLCQRVRKEQRDQAKPFIEEMERDHILTRFAIGKSLRLDTIAPRIHICRTEEDLRTFRYCRLLQTVPNMKRVGRQIEALVFDHGQGERVLMGAIGLASSPYTLGCLDRFLKWSDRQKKQAGLKSIMDLAVCMAVPPYSYLLGGKLVALLAMADPLNAEFHRRYGTPLLGLMTTCSTGIHCPIFNRIMIRPGGLYRRIGKTAGYTSVFFSSHTLDAARNITGYSYHFSNRERPFPSKSMRSLRKAMTVCGIPRDRILRLGNQKGVYFACLSDDDLESLRTGVISERNGSLSVDDAVTYWRNKILAKRQGLQDTIRIIRSFCPQAIALSNSSRTQTKSLRTVPK